MSDTLIKIIQIVLHHKLQELHQWALHQGKVDE
jgi:hypothetical protein